MSIAQEKPFLSPSLVSLSSDVDVLLEHIESKIRDRQEDAGYWHYALDDNMTMNAEYILFHEWLGLNDEVLIRRLASAMLKRQNADGSWSLYFDGPGNLSATIECYFALRVAGHSLNDPSMLRARDFILRHGGIPKSRVFTKIWLALFDLFPWNGIPMIPPEIMLAPRTIPFNIYEFSYWSRVTIVPLTILFHIQKTKKLSFDLDELYLDPADKLNTEILPPPAIDESWFIPNRKWDFGWINWEQVFVALSRGVSIYESKVPIKPLRNFCVQLAKKWILKHQEKGGGWGGIQPPMLNSIMALHALGMPLTNPVIQRALEALRKFTRGMSREIRAHEHESHHEAVLQSCVSPIWDTALAALGLLEAGADPRSPELQKTKDWLWAQRIEHRGDWSIKARLKRGQPFAAWCFQFENTNYPDVDDTAMVALTLYKLGMNEQELKPALNWIFAMQNSDGGWGTFDRNNTQVILNRIPFADLKSLIDPSNPDVTAHALELLGEMGLGQIPEVKRAVRYLRRVQRSEGAWFGRWGVNLLYGTSAVLVGLSKINEPRNASYVDRALKFILNSQNPDGGWGETCGSYHYQEPNESAPSTPSQTAWALMALIAWSSSDESFAEPIQRALRFLKSRRADDGFFEQEFTGTGFPQHFYLRYDGYRNFFPLIALGRLQRRLRLD